MFYKYNLNFTTENQGAKNKRIANIISYSIFFITIYVSIFIFYKLNILSNSLLFYLVSTILLIGSFFIVHLINSKIDNKISLSKKYIALLEELKSKNIPLGITTTEEFLECKGLYISFILHIHKKHEENIFCDRKIYYKDIIQLEYIPEEAILQIIFEDILDNSECLQKSLCLSSHVENPEILYEDLRTKLSHLNS
ncbi:MAG: hypothetical protein ACRC41_11640 [Sarcina sp.]